VENTAKPQHHAMSLPLDPAARGRAPVNPDHNDAAASETSTSSLPSQPAPIVLPDAAIADDDGVDPFEPMPPPSPASATPSCNAASRGRKRVKELSDSLRSWMERHPKPYSTLEIDEALDSQSRRNKVFFNNFRKRCSKSEEGGAADRPTGFTVSRPEGGGAAEVAQMLDAGPSDWLHGLLGQSVERGSSADVEQEGIRPGGNPEAKRKFL